MRDITAEITMETFMNGWIQHFGCPVTIVTDQGSQFTGHLWKSHMKILGIKHITITSIILRAIELLKMSIDV